MSTNNTTFVGGVGMGVPVTDPYFSWAVSIISQSSDLHKVCLDVPFEDYEDVVVELAKLTRDYGHVFNLRVSLEGDPAYDDKKGDDKFVSYDTKYRARSGRVYKMGFCYGH